MYSGADLCLYKSLLSCCLTEGKSVVLVAVVVVNSGSLDGLE